jgi:hypothetical protein
MKEGRGGLKERPGIKTRGVEHEENHNLGDTQEELRGTKSDAPPSSLLDLKESNYVKEWK